MRNPKFDPRRKYRKTDDTPSNITQPGQDGDRDIGEQTRDFAVVERGHWSSNPSQSLISIFRLQSACSGSHRLNMESIPKMVCDGRSWKGFRGVDGGMFNVQSSKLMVDVHDQPLSRHFIHQTAPITADISL